MKKTIAAFMCILSISSASSAELSVIGHGFAKHADNHDFNERPYGAGLRYEHGEYAVQLGDYHNSLRRNSFYVGLDWSPIHTNLGGCVNFGSGMYFGGATGYKYAVTPMAGVQASLRCKSVFVRVRAMPDVFYNSKLVGAVEVGVVLMRF